MDVQLKNHQKLRDAILSVPKSLRNSSKVYQIKMLVSVIIRYEMDVFSVSGIHCLAVTFFNESESKT